MQLPRSPPGIMMKVNLPHLTECLDAQLCEYLEWLWHEGAHVGWPGDAISGCQFFLQKKRYFPAAWELLRTWKREEPPLQAPPLTGPIVFALIATALARNLTGVAALVAIGYGGFLRTMEVLTRQRHQITAHSSCNLLTLPITKTTSKLKTLSNSLKVFFNLFFVRGGGFSPWTSARQMLRPEYRSSSTGSVVINAKLPRRYCL